MPYVNIKITREGVTVEQKAELIAGVTELLVRVLNKNPATTVVVIDEVDIPTTGVLRTKRDDSSRSSGEKIRLCLLRLP